MFQVFHVPQEVKLKLMMNCLQAFFFALDASSVFVSLISNSSFDSFIGFLNLLLLAREINEYLGSAEPHC